MTTPFLGTTVQTGIEEVKVAFINDGSQTGIDGVAHGVRYDIVMGFPALKEQMDEGKGSKQNPITVISTIPVGLLMLVTEMWNACSNLIYDNNIPLDEETVIHNGTKDKSIDELKSNIAVMEELRHPIVEAMKYELQLREKGNWSSEESTSTSSLD